MQDEVNEKVVALSVRATKMTANVLKAAMLKFIAEMEKAKQKTSKQNTVKRNEPTHGKQTLKKLMKQNSQLTNIEITDGNIKSFERVARKYGVDFSLKRDNAENPPKYIVFFKAKDVDVMTAAFKEFAGKEIKKTKKPSIRKRLAKAVEVARDKMRLRTRLKDKNRGQSR